MKFFCVLFLLYVFYQVNSQQVSRLKSYNVDSDWITLSGFSSGGTFAQQLQFSYSSLFKGIAVFSHTYYRCGPPNGRINAYDNVCTKLNSTVPDYNVGNAINEIEDYARRGLIENPNNLKNTKLYVYAGTKNSLFTTDQSLRILDIYERYIKYPSQICTRIQAAELVLPSNNYGGPCGEDAESNLFIANCGYSGAYESLNFLLGYSIERPKKNIAIHKLELFDQTEFFRGVNGRIDMDSVGFIYVPSSCRDFDAYCLLHFYFHGCLVGRQYNGSQHIEKSGFLEVAEANHIIMVFPQAISGGENNIGCWDTFGVTGPDYATKRGAQVSVVRKIIERLQAKKSIHFGETHAASQFKPSTQFFHSKPIKSDENHSPYQNTYYSNYNF